MAKSQTSGFGSGFLAPGARQAFNELRQAFIETSILHHFDPDCHIQIKTDVLSYIIGKVLSQLTSDNLNQWHLVAFFSKKRIPAIFNIKTMTMSFWQLLKLLRLGTTI